MEFYVSLPTLHHLNYLSYYMTLVVVIKKYLGTVIKYLNEADILYSYL